MMGLVYHFVSLDQTQVARRRQLLDNYGQFAQISALVIPLLAFQASFAVRFLVQKLWSSGKKKEHQSPRVSHFPKPSAISSSSYWSRLRWALDEQIVQGWGTRLEWFIGVIWTMWLLLLVVKDTGDDYLHLTKRFGIVAASQLPVHYLLAAKSWSPIQYLTHMSHEELNPYHRLLGRIIITFFSVHASMYLNFFVQSSLLRKRIQDRDVILGLLAIITFLIIGTTAISKIRTYSYRLFFILHVVLSISVLPTLYFHVSHLRIYILESVAIYAILILQRNISATLTSATIVPLPSSSLLSIILHPGAKLKHTYTPGQHIYLSLPQTPSAPFNKLRTNPFTIANLPSSDGYMNLIIRPLSGTTQILSTIAAAKSKRSSQLVIEGPYGAAPYFPDLTESYDRILLVAGGVGASFTLPIYRSLLQQVRGGSADESKIRFVWSVREEGDALWGIQYLQGDGRSSLLHGFEVYISGPRDQTNGSSEAAEESIELEERNRLLQDGENTGEQSTIEIGASANRGRPNLKQIVDDVFGHDESEKVAVLVCGPVSMGRALRREVGRWVTKGREVFWHNEEFGW